MASFYFCPRGCGKKLRKGDKTALYFHNLTCKKQVWNGGKIGGK
jgi:hypothetical protein